MMRGVVLGQMDCKISSIYYFSDFLFNFTLSKFTSYHLPEYIELI